MKSEAFPETPPHPNPSPSRGGALRPTSLTTSQPMLLHPAVERGAGEAELGGGERDVVAVLLQRLLDQLLLGAVEVEVVARRRGRRRRRGGARRGEAAREREIRAGEGIAVGEDDGALAGMAQRADVAGPVIGLERAGHVGWKLPRRLAVFPGILGDEMVGEREDVLAALAQRRQVDLDRVEPEQEVLAEAAFVGKLLGR